MVSAICTLALIVGVLSFATASSADVAPPQPSNPWSYSQTTNIRNGNTGNVGIAIDKPEARLHVGKGADANVQEGGFLVLGQVSGKNLALDDNEIMARENGKPADLTLQAEGGNLIIQSFKSDRDSRVGIGNPKPLAPLSVSSPSTASDNSTLENFGVLIQSLGEQYFGQFLIANRRIRVSRLQGKFATNGKSRVSEYELKTVRTIDYNTLPLFILNQRQMSRLPP